jgi:cell division protein FtsA
MSKDQIISAIDIGTSKITTVIAKRGAENGKINIIGVASYPSTGMRKSQIVDIEEVVRALTESVEAAERMAGYSLLNAFVSISGSHIDSLNSKGVVAVAEPDKEIINEDIERVIEAAKAVSLPASREILHVIPRDFIVDSQPGIRDPLGMTGIRLEVETHIITGSTTAMKNIVKCVEELGIEVQSLVFSGLAASQAVLTDTEKELGVSLVDIGGGTTSVAVFVEGSLAYSAVLPVGARNITNDIAIGMRLSLEDAEKVKVALSKDKKTGKDQSDEIDFEAIGIDQELEKTSRKTIIDGIIKPRLDEIFEMVGEELKESGFGGSTPAGVVVTGGGAETVGIEKSCKRILSLPMRKGEPQGLSGLVEEIKGPEFAVIQGLVKYGVKQQAPGMSMSFSFGDFSGFVKKLSLSKLVNKFVEFIKSFLP